MIFSESHKFTGYEVKRNAQRYNILCLLHHSSRVARVIWVFSGFVFVIWPFIWRLDSCFVLGEGEFWGILGWVFSGWVRQISACSSFHGDTSSRFRLHRYTCIGDEEPLMQVGSGNRAVFYRFARRLALGIRPSQMHVGPDNLRRDL